MTPPVTPPVPPPPPELSPEEVAEVNRQEWWSLMAMAALGVVLVGVIVYLFITESSMPGYKWHDFLSFD